jgi:hypothetical protein
MLNLFESMTGWVVEFEESPASRRQRCQADRSSTPKTAPNATDVSPRGHFLIVDMSASWPCGRPTAHRGKCDQFIKLFSDLVHQSQLTTAELKRLRNSVLQTQTQHRTQNQIRRDSDDACDNITDDIADGFLPRYPYLTQAELDGEFEIDSHDNSFEADQTTRQPKSQTKTDNRAPTVAYGKPSSQWQIGGRRGIADNRYVDWSLRKDRRIALMIGQFERLDSLGDRQPETEWEARLTLNPETSRFWFSVNAQGTFWVLDRPTGQLQPITHQNRIMELKPNQALVATTAVLKPVAHESRLQDSCENADDLAAALQHCWNTEEPVLVLLRQ